MIGEIVSFAGDKRLWVVIQTNGTFVTCTLVGDDSKRVTCKRDDLTRHSVESLLHRYEGMSNRARAASFAHRLPLRRLKELKYIQFLLHYRGRRY